jgi:hypothetical protein
MKEGTISIDGRVSEVSPYDLTRGRITFRHKSSSMSSWCTRTLRT